MSQNDTPSLNIAAHPALGGRGGLLSICVVDATSDVLRVATLDQEAEPAKENSHQAIHGPKIFSKKRKTTNEKARSADEKYIRQTACQWRRGRNCNRATKSSPISTADSEQLWRDNLRPPQICRTSCILRQPKQYPAQTIHKRSKKWPTSSADCCPHRL